MGLDELQRILSGMVRIGTVMIADEKTRMARVKFQSENLVSGWLYVVNARPCVRLTEEQNAEELPVRPWMPAANANVLCLYLPVFNGDGFILGEI